jgi:5-amino-6-(5-phospho-D-ribitylamino)uracil phosphatase
MIDLVVTDLDGTLWGSDEQVHDLTLDALRTLDRRPTPVLVATGRRLSGAVGALARSGLELPAVVLDGALGHDVRVGRTFHQARFDAEAATAVLAGFADAGLSPCVYVAPPGPEVMVGPAPSTHPRHLELIGAHLAHDDLGRVVADDSVLMFAVVAGPPAALEAVAQAVGDVATATITRDIVFGGATLTVRPHGITKWDGVLAWCADQGIDPGRVLAVGDGQNDLELLGAARVACVVRDGCEEALALADHVIGPACAGGWAQILDLL